MNFRHLASIPPTFTDDPRFTSPRVAPAAFERLKSFCRDVVASSGVAYKDVVQPFIVADLLGDTPVAKLRLRRPLADIALAMERRDWTYPDAAAEVECGRRGAIEGLIRGARALAGLDDGAVETLDYDDVAADEGALTAALRRLYPDAQLVAAHYMDGAFRRRREQLLERRESRDYRVMEELIAEVSDRIGVAVPDGWGPVRAAPRTSAAARSQDRPPVVLVVGDAVAPTGFARVTGSLMARLAPRYGFHQIGINYHGDPHSLPWPLYPAGIGGDAHGVNRIADLTARLKPDVVLMVNDIWIVGDYLQALAACPHRASTVAYIPIDSAPIPPDYVRRLQGLDALVVYTPFAAEAVREAAERVARIDPTFEPPPVSVIPHGVDTQVFHPLFPLDEDLARGRREVRRRILPQRADFEDAFIVLNANRNQPRKRIDLTLAGFALFAADKPPNVKLYLHMGATDQGWDVRELGRRYDLTDRLLMSSDAPGPPELSLEQLNQVYNVCDVGLNTAEGEGWGLASFEHAATGAAQIVPGHSGPASIWKDAATLLTPSLRITRPELLVDAWLVGPEAVAASLEAHYRDSGYLRQRSLDAYDLATAEAYSWDRIASEFDALLSRYAAPTARARKAARPGS